MVERILPAAEPPGTGITASASTPEIDPPGTGRRGSEPDRVVAPAVVGRLLRLVNRRLLHEGNPPLPSCIPAARVDPNHGAAVAAAYETAAAPPGELTAGRVHTATFSPLARAALFTETVGQTLWFHFGPHAHLDVAQRPYAVQKGVVLPEPLRRFA